MHTQHFSLSPDAYSFVTIQALQTDELSFLLISQARDVFLFDPNTSTLSPSMCTLNEDIDLNRIKIYSYGPYCCIVDNRGTKGVVISLEDQSFRKELSRGDYQVKHCSFPIAFYSREDQTFLIHGTDWNRLDITCLETDELLTDRIVEYESNTNYVDYFHSLLSISPDESHFISNGWVWSPVDVITLYTIEEFLSQYEEAFAYIDLDGESSGYLWDRPSCWIDSDTLAIGYNKQEEFVSKNFPSELHFLNIKSREVIRKITFDGFHVNDYGEISGSLFHDQFRQQLIVLHPDKGVYISDYEGNLLYQDKHFLADGYADRHHAFFSIKGEELIIQSLPEKN